MRRAPVFIYSLLLCLTPLSSFAQAKLEKAPPLTDAAVPSSIRSAVETTGARIVRPDGSVLCEIWLRKSLPRATAAPAKAAAYPQLSESALVGVVSFPNGASDFRGQSIKPGFYTMRYELLPEDGNHMGVAPTRDFVLLLPASAEPDPAAKYDYAQMVKLSSQASEANHPAVFLLLTPDGGEERTFRNADGFQVYASSIKTEDGKAVPIALVVKGRAEQ